MQARSTTATHLGEDYDALMSQAVSAKGAAVSCEDMRNCFFGSYVDSTKAPEERDYAEVANVMLTGGTSSLLNSCLEGTEADTLSLYGCCNLVNHAVMQCYRQIMSGTVPAGYEEYIPKNHPRLTAPMMPSSSSVYNFTFNKDRAEWQAWSDTLPSATIPAGSDFSDIIVPTQDSSRYTFLLDTALRHAQPILFVGPTGQSPSLTLQ